MCFLEKGSMGTTSKVVYVVIVTWNGDAWIRQAIESLQRSTFPVRIVVVDNASVDETVSTVRNYYKNVEILCMPTNLGFARATNHGIRHALSQGVDHVLLLNQDVKVAPTTVELLVNILDTHPDYGIISPLPLDYQGNGIDPVFLQHIKDNVVLLSDAFSTRLKEVYEMIFVNAAVWLVTSHLLQEVGGFDPLFFMYGEDQDYCQRVRFHGFKVGLSPKTIAYHWHGGSSDKSHTFREQCVLFYAIMLYRLKRPERFFLQSFLSLIPTWSRRSIMILMDLDLKGFCAIIHSFSKVLIYFFPIWKHHRISKQRGSSWL